MQTALIIIFLLLHYEAKIENYKNTITIIICSTYQLNDNYVLNYLHHQNYMTRLIFHVKFILQTLNFHNILYFLHFFILTSRGLEDVVQEEFSEGNKHID